MVAACEFETRIAIGLDTKTRTNKACLKNAKSESAPRRIRFYRMKSFRFKKGEPHMSRRRYKAYRKLLELVKLILVIFWLVWKILNELIG